MNQQQQMAQEQAQFQRAVSAIEQGEFALAEVHLQKVLVYNPHHTGALVNYIGCLEQQGRRGESLSYMASLHRLHPENTVFALTYAKALQTANQSDQAVQCLRACLNSGAQEPMVLAELAWSYWSNNNVIDSSAFAHWALAVDSSCSRALLLVVQIYASQGQLELAIDAQRRYLTFAPEDLRAQLKLGDLYEQSGQLVKALEMFVQVRSLQPNNSDLWALTGRVLTELTRHRQARQAFEEALRIEPRNSKAFYHFGNLLCAQGQYIKAKSCYEQAMEIDPAFKNGVYNLGLCHLALGEQVLGFEKYQTRWSMPSHRRDILEIPLPIWDGAFSPSPSPSPSPAVHLLVWTEQGVGDSLFFAQSLYALEQIAERTAPGFRISFACDVRLKSTFAMSFTHIHVVSYSEEALSHLLTHEAPTHQMAVGDVLCWLWDEYKLGNFPEAVVQGERQKLPLFKAYLRVDQGRKANLLQDHLEQFRKDTGAAPLQRIGLSWHSKGPKIGGDRSVPLSTFVPMMKANPNIQWVNLQYGDHSKELLKARAQLGHDSQFVEPGVDSWNDLEGLLAVIATLDLVMTIDNSTVHMAGCVGVPTWLMLGEVHNWRWPLQGDDTFWYPSVEIKRWNRRELRKRAQIWQKSLPQGLEN